MKLVVNIQLKPTAKQVKSLSDTLECCTAACNEISQRGFAAGLTRQYDLHKLLYDDTRKVFDLTAQAAVSCIPTVADAQTAQKTRGREKSLVRFRKHAAQPYDDRIFRFVADDMVSIWTLSGRQKIPFACGDRQRRLLAFREGEVDLMLVRGKWYLACVCDVLDPAEVDVEGVLGVDFGIVNLAFDREGGPYSGVEIEYVRQKLSRRRAGLQRRCAKGAKRRHKKLSGKEARFRKHVNHCIAKQIVLNAERSHFAIAIEDLTHIPSRVKARKAQRSRLHSWSFSQPRQFVAYKTKLAGVLVIAVDPRNTSRYCPECGFIDKANRKTRETFPRTYCGHITAADFAAARDLHVAGAARP
jgi:IS605 OrfB family transposase